MTRSILVVGAGATGGYFGARLAQADRDVTFLVHPERAAALRERGLTIVSPEAAATISTSVITAGEITHPYDIVLLAVPATVVESAIDDLSAAVGPDTVIIPFLNGMRHLAVLNQRFGEDAVFGGVIKVATDTTAAGEIILLAPAASLDLGSQSHGVTSRGMEIVAELNVASLEVRAIEDIVGAMWHKWVFITSVTATTILGGGPIGDVVGAEGGAVLGLAILSEAASISEAARYPLSASELATLKATLTQAESTLTTSLYRAVAAGRATETEPMLGDFVGRARVAGLSTPLLDAATLRLRVYENNRKKSEP